MRRRTRLLLYGSCVLLALAAVLAALTLPGSTGGAVVISAGSLAGIGLISLMFMEVGLSEDRERARAGSQRDPQPERVPPAEPGPPARRRLSRPPRRRG